MGGFWFRFRTQPIGARRRSFATLRTDMRSERRPGLKDAVSGWALATIRQCFLYLIYIQDKLFKSSVDELRYLTGIRSKDALHG